VYLLADYLIRLLMAQAAYNASARPRKRGHQVNCVTHSGSAAGGLWKV
jgi:hypothetical protein